MIKKMTTLSIALMCSLSLLACHGSRDKEAFKVPDTFNDKKNIEITFWAKNDTNKTQVEIYDKAIADFSNYYPNITVNVRYYNDYGKIYNDVITNLSTNTTPNVCMSYPDHIATYMTGSNQIVKLDDLANDEKFGLGGTEVRFESPKMEDMIPEFIKECRLDSELVALPFMRSTEACYVNKTYVEALGYELPDILTWDFIYEVSEAALAKDASDNYKVNGQNIMIPFIYKSTDNMMISSLKQLNAPYSGENGSIEIFNDYTKEILTDVGIHAKSGAFSTFKISGYPANFLNAGQCIFAVDSTAGATWMGSEAPLIDISEDKLVKFETEVLPIPQYDAKNPKMISQGPSLCIFNKADVDEVLASWLFAQFLLTNNVQSAYSQTEGYIPVSNATLQSEEYQDYISRSGEDNGLHYDVKIKAAKLLLENTENTFITPVFPGSTSLRDAAGQMIENTAKAVRRKQTVDEAYFDKLFEEMISLYRLDSLGGTVNTNISDLGELGMEAKVLLYSLAVAWVLIVAIFAFKMIKYRRS